MRALILPLAAALAVGCPPPEPGLDENFGVTESRGDPACENLDTTACMFPFPSDRYVVRDGDTTRLALEVDALPVNNGGVPFRVEVFDGLDGFGVATPAMFHLLGAVLPGVEGVFDPEPSMGPDANTVLIDAATGARIPHWLEVDYLTPDAPRVFVLRPAVPLPRATRIVVGVRGLRDSAGELVDAPAPFAALRDQAASRHLGVHARRARFEGAVFPTLESAGFARDELQLAWEFTTASTEGATRDLLTMRDRMLAQVGAGGPGYAWTSVVEVEDPDIAVIADGIAQVPSFLLPPDDLGIRRIRRDEQGLPESDGFEAVPFRLQIPHSVRAASAPSPVLQYGHGFLGRRAESNNRWLRSLAEEHQFSVLAANMQGMDETVLSTWLAGLADNGGNLVVLAEEALQGVTNHLALQRVVAGPLAHDDHALLAHAGDAPAIDPDTVWYYGNSQGGSVGTVIMGLSVDVERGVLGVPGCAYPFLMHRSYVFGGYAAYLSALYGDPADVSLMVGLVGTGWDRFEPLTFAPHITTDPLPGTPPHQVLLHVAREDGQVLNEVSHVLARAVGAPLLTPAVRSIWGVDEVATPYEGSAAITEYDFGIPPHDDPLVPRPAEPDSHGWLRAQPEGRAQMMTFLREGRFVHTCDGPCAFDGPP